MTNEVLYFPNVRVPRNEWFTRVLLYWDRVGTIVPQFLSYRLPAYMRELVGAELLTVVEPQEHLGAPEVGEFNELFRGFVAARVGESPRLTQSFSDGNTAPLFAEKLSQPLARDLCDLGVARRVGGFEYEVEESIAYAYMAHLARFVGSRRGMQPITDERTNLEAAVLAGAADEREGVRVEVLEAVLPAPANPPPLHELVDFKASYRDLLVSFRHRVEATVIDIASIADAGMREARKELAIRALTEERDEIAKRLAEAGWSQVSFGALCELTAAAFGGVAAVATGEPMVGAAALFALLAAGSRVAGDRDSDHDLLNAPLAYAALAARQHLVAAPMGGRAAT